MRKNARAIEILLAGPSDVKRELQVARDVIEHWNAAHSRTENTLLQAIYWDTHAFPEIGDRPQGIINRQLVDRCDLLIAVFWKSIGSPTGVAPSGTIEEIERFRDSGRPVMLYFSQARIPHDADIAKIDQVRKYKNSLNNGLYWVFKSPAQFREQLSVHLPQAIAQFQENAANPVLASSRWLQDQNAALNRIQAELETTRIVNDFPAVLAKLRPLLLDCVALPNVARIREARQNFQSLIRRVSEMERFSFSSGTVSEFSDRCDQLFSDIRLALEQAAAIEGLDEWEVVRYEDLRKKRAEHTSETAWNWQNEDQCQCAECSEFRSLQLKIKDDLNMKFRCFFLDLLQQFSSLRSRDGSESSTVWTWIDTTAKGAQRFQDSFQVQEQFQNAQLAQRAVNVFGPLTKIAADERSKYTKTDFKKLFVTIEPLVQMFAALKGPS